MGPVAADVGVVVLAGSKTGCCGCGGCGCGRGRGCGCGWLLVVGCWLLVVVVAVVVVVVVVVVVGNPGPEQRDRATAVHGRLSPRWPVVRGHTAPHTWGQRPGRRV